MTARRAAELLRSAELVGRQQMAFAKRPEEEESVPRQPGTWQRKDGDGKRPAGLPSKTPPRRR